MPQVSRCGMGCNQKHIVLQPAGLQCVVHMVPANAELMGDVTPAKIAIANTNLTISNHLLSRLGIADHAAGCAGLLPGCPAAWAAIHSSYFHPLPFSVNSVPGQGSFRHERLARLGQADIERQAVIAGALAVISELRRDPAVEQIEPRLGYALAILVRERLGLFAARMLAQADPGHMALVVQIHAAAETAVSRRLRIVVDRHFPRSL